MQRLPSIESEIRDLHLLRLSHVLNSELEVPLLNNKKQKSMQFLPFLQERDGIGKLIHDPNKPHQNKQFLPGFSSRLTTSIRYDERQKEEDDYLTSKFSSVKLDNVVDQLQGYHRQEDKERRVRFEKFRLVKGIDPKIEIRTNYVEFRREEINRNGLPKSIKEVIVSERLDAEDKFIDNSFKFKKSVSVLIQKEKSSRSLSERKQSCEIPKLNCKKLLRHKLLEQQKPKTERRKAKISDIDEELNQQSGKVKVSRQHPELKRFKRMEKLSIQVINDFQYNHIKLLTMIRETKMTAIKIKQEIQVE